MKLKKSNNRLYPSYMMWPAALIFFFFFMLPVILSFIMSFTDWNLNRLTSPQFIGLDNFSYIFKDSKFFLSVQNTFTFAIATAIFKTLLGLILAIALNRQLRTRNIMRTLYYLPAVLSMVVVGILVKAIFNNDGLFNNLLSSIGLGALRQDWVMGKTTALTIVIVAEVWRWTGFNMAIFLAGLQGISGDYYEAARIDGATSHQQFWKITIPLLIPSFTVNVVFNIIGGLKVFDQVFIITGGGPGFTTQVLSTYIFNNYSQGLLGRSTAMSLILFIVVLVCAAGVNTVLKRKEVDI